MTPDHDPDPAGSSGAPRLVVVMVAVLAALVVLGLTAALVGWWVAKEPGAAAARLDQRGEVTRVAEQFTVRVNNYEADSVDEYKASVGELLSTKFRGGFDEAMEEIVGRVQEAEMESRGEVLASGVASLDDDSARVLVAADASVTTVYDERQRHFRWEVSLVKVDGEWLVDDFTPVGE